MGSAIVVSVAVISNIIIFFVSKILDFGFAEEEILKDMAHLQLNWKLKNSENQNNQQTMKDKYKLREASIKKRIEVEHRKKEPKKRGPKPRPKSQPMSKYRRKTANLRERQRMGEINTAFEKLREKIPTPIQAKNAKLEKLTKINILHVAINYIRA